MYISIYIPVSTSKIYTKHERDGVKNPHSPQVNKHISNR